MRLIFLNIFSANDNIINIFCKKRIKINNLILNKTQNNTM